MIITKTEGFKMYKSVAFTIITVLTVICLAAAVVMQMQEMSIYEMLPF